MLWFTSLQMHTLTRLFPPYALWIAAATAAAILSCATRVLPRQSAVLMAAGVGCVIYVLTIDFMYSGEVASASNVMRFLTPFVVTGILLLSRIAERDVARISSVFLVVVVLAALSIVYQVLFGPVSWFAEPGERAGLQRYASLLGSLTVYGVAAPIALLCAARYVRSATAFSLIALLLLVTGVMSLQKAFVAGLVIALPFCLLLRGRRGVSGLAVAGAGSALAGLLLAPADVLDYVEVAWRYFTDPDMQTGDVAIGTSVFDRLITYPRELVALHGAASLAMGIGLRGGSGIFGFEDFPMAHNALIDFMIIGGVPYLLYGLYFLVAPILMCVSFPRLVRHGMVARNDALFASGLCAVFIANVPFSSGIQFHPATCWVPALLVAYAFSITSRVRAGCGGHGSVVGGA